ncbi:MAG: hypothetical protein ACE5HT_01210 [Gemmatimonadales bacterium]
MRSGRNTPDVSTPATILLLLLAIAFILFVALPRKHRLPSTGSSDDIDLDELTQAEEELQELDAMTTPDEADDKLPDWGPGAPKPR